MQSVGRSVTNVWVQLQWFRYSTSTWFYPKMQTASVLLLCHSTENSISDWGLAVWDIALRFFVIPLGTHRCYQTILQPNISTFDFWCHPNNHPKEYCTSVKGEKKNSQVKLTKQISNQFNKKLWAHTWYKGREEEVLLLLSLMSVFWWSGCIYF